MIAPARTKHMPSIEEQEEADIYTTDGVMEYFDDDEINEMEEAFMRGYLEADTAEI